MKISDIYSWSKDWRLVTIERQHDVAQGTEYFLENSYSGKIIIDKLVNDVLEFLATADTGKNFTQIDLQKIVPTHLLEIILTVFAQLGVLDINKEGDDSKIIYDEIPLMIKRPFISIIIINYNGIKHLPPLLNSLMQQTYGNFEIIIVDNYSKDDSCKFLREQCPEIKLLALKKNIGFAAGVNEGIKESTGEFILVLNNDIILDINAIYYLVERAIILSYGIGAKDWGALAPKMMFYNNPNFINAIGNSLYPITWGSDNFIGSFDIGQFDRFKNPMSACFGAVLINRKAWDIVGPLDTHYKFYYEDMDWSFRSQLCNYSIEAEPRSIFYHKFGASMSLKSQSFKLRYIVGNRLYFTLKNLEKSTIRRFLKNYIWEDIKSAAIYLKHMNFPLVMAYIRGYARLFFSLPGLFFKRDAVQQKRYDYGTNDANILAKSVPLNSTLMENGVPVLDVYSLRSNYAFLWPDEEIPNPGPEEDIILWHLRPPRKDRNAPAKIYIEFSFLVPEPGYYDLHLLGLIKRKSDYIIYLDGQLIKPDANVDKKNKAFIMNFQVSKAILLEKGRHLLELGRRSQVYAVVLRKNKASWPPAKAFDNTN
ncbi:MAG: glycosyltransferase family 2 protein [Acidobacteria bacterium]|nr:glycosyltransferase family 2 protein [Acidobacteriota bacterium]